jgi:hypothetical protein
MSAARKSSFNRNAAIAAIQISWKKISPDGDRDERLAWIAEFLGRREVRSVTDLSDDQLGAVAGEMKRLTGQSAQPRQTSVPSTSSAGSNVVQAAFGRGSNAGRGDHETIHLASPEQVYTLDKLQKYLRWSQDDVFEFIKKRVLRGKARLSPSIPNFHMLTFRQATTATNALLHVAGHRDLKLRNGGKPVSRVELNKYIPILKRQLKIDQAHPRDGAESQSGQ